MDHHRAFCPSRIWGAMRSLDATRFANRHLQIWQRQWKRKHKAHAHRDPWNPNSNFETKNSPNRLPHWAPEHTDYREKETLFIRSFSILSLARLFLHPIRRPRNMRVCAVTMTKRTLSHKHHTHTHTVQSVFTVNRAGDIIMIDCAYCRYSLWNWNRAQSTEHEMLGTFLLSALFVCFAYWINRRLPKYLDMRSDSSRRSLLFGVVRVLATRISSKPSKQKRQRKSKKKGRTNHHRKICATNLWLVCLYLA